MLVLTVLSLNVVRRRRARRSRPAGQGARSITDGPLRRPPADLDGLRAVRRLGAHVPDLQRDPERRPGGADGGQAADPHADRGDPRASGASTTRSTSSTTTTMEKLFTGDLICYFTQLNVVDEIWKGIPRTFSLAIGAAIIWMFFGVALGLFSADARREGLGPIAHRARPDRHLDAGLLDRGADEPLPGLPVIERLGFELFPNGGYVEFTDGPVRVVPPPDPALDRARDPVHRLLLAGPARQHPRHDQRGLRAHRAGQGPVRAPGAAPPRAAQLDDPDRHALGPGLRGR